jgi:hypothetical protein
VFWPYFSSLQNFPDTSPAFVTVNTAGVEHYNLGVTNVTLNVTDSYGESALCSANVTVTVRSVRREEELCARCQAPHAASAVCTLLALTVRDVLVAWHVACKLLRMPWWH